MEERGAPPPLALVERFFGGTGRSYDRVVGLCTTGFDGYWKRRILREIPPNPTALLDQASGTGLLTLRLARAFPGARVVGVELRPEYNDLAAARAAREGVANVEFLVGRAEEVRPGGVFDCAVSSYLAKYADLDELADNLWALLAPGGKIVLHDFSYPSTPILRAGWNLYYALVSAVGRLLFPEWRTVFDELPALVKTTRWVEKSVASLTRKGFAEVRVRPLTFGAAAMVTAKKPPGGSLESSADLT